MPIPVMAVYGLSTGRNFTGSTSIATFGQNHLVTLASDTGDVFDLKSLDLSEHSAIPAFSPAIVTFTGTRADNSTVTQTVMSDGPFGLETFHFVEFTNLVSVTWLSSNSFGDVGTVNTFYQIDNIVLQSTP